MYLYFLLHQTLEAKISLDTETTEYLANQKSYE